MFSGGALEEYGTTLVYGGTNVQVLECSAAFKNDGWLRSCVGVPGEESNVPAAPLKTLEENFDN
jgi:hypothetical protein